MAGDHYSEFIEDAFVKPIRSVLIVDDDYPTFEEMLDAQLARDAFRPHSQTRRPRSANRTDELGERTQRKKA